MIAWFLVLTVFADEYAERLALVQSRAQEIHRKIESFGGNFSTSTLFDQRSGSKPEALPKLFTAHGNLNAATLPLGKEIRAILETRLIVGGELSPVILRALPDQGMLSGLRIMGKGRQGGTFGRVNLDLTNLLTHSGQNIPIQAVALDHAGAFGIEAEVISGKLLAIGGSIASSFISGLAAGQQTTTTNPFGFSQVAPTGRNAILQGVAQTAADQSRRLVEESTKEKPILVIERGEAVTVLLESEVRL